MTRITKSITALFITALFLSAASLSAAEFTIKVATMAPKGTVWAKYIYKMRKELQKKSGGRIKVKVYDGGKLGSETAMIRKLKNNQIQMASFTGIGLGHILSEARVLEVPYMFSNYKQVDRVVKKLYPEFKAKLDKKGYVLAGWGETGPVYILSKKPVAGYNDMKGLKAWAPTGDKMVKSLFQEFGLVPVYQSFENVLTQLQTGGLDVVYAPPAGAIGLQWHTQVKYITDMQLAISTGANLMNKKAFNKLPKDLQKLVIQVSEGNAKKMVKASRKANARALRSLKKRLIVIKPNPKALKDLKKKARMLENALVKKGLFTRALLNKAKAAR